ncbi:MAG: NYN domain-containing protein [Acidiphilium sp.]|nr:NYN domain-containing protein [Acidiphilium sp.]
MSTSVDWDVSPTVPSLAPYEKTAVFIHLASLFRSAKLIGKHVDFAELRDHLITEYNPSTFRAYVTVTVASEVGNISGLVQWMMHNGYHVVQREKRVIASDYGPPRVIGNIDMDFAVDVMECAQSLDHAILFFGSSDGTRLIEALHRRNVRVTVAGVYGTRDSSVSNEIYKAADDFLAFEDFPPAVIKNAGDI